MEMALEKEEEFRREMAYWKNKCLAAEGKMEKLEEAIKEKLNAEGVESMSNDVVKIKKDIAGNKKGISEMEVKWDAKFKSLSEKFFTADQYSRKNNLLLKGFRYLPNLHGSRFIHFIADMLNFLFPSLGGKILPIHIDDAHPLKTKKNSSTKVVIIKFVNRWIKDEIIDIQDDLINTNLSVSEHLTEYTLQILASAQSAFGNKNVWVHKTLVHAIVNGTRHTLRTLTDLEKVKPVSDQPAVLDNFNPNPVTAAVPSSEDRSTNSTKQTQHTDSVEYIRLLDEKNKTAPVSTHPRGYATRNGRGRGGNRRPSQFRKKRFHPHPDFYTSNSYGTTYYG